MIKYLRLPFNFDVQRMQHELNALDKGAWQLHYQKLHYEGDWSAIPLRSDGGRADNIIITPGQEPDYQDTVFLHGQSYFKEVLSAFQCPLMAVRLLKLTPGAVIKEHRDAELYFEKGEARIHIPVITNKAVEFYLDKERIILQEGECWYMNFNLLHSIHNKSNQPRVHLVIDAVVDDWMTALFSGHALTRKDIKEPVADVATQQQIISQLRQMNTPTGHQLADQLEAALQVGA